MQKLNGLYLQACLQDRSCLLHENFYSQKTDYVKTKNWKISWKYPKKILNSLSCTICIRWPDHCVCKIKRHIFFSQNNFREWKYVFLFILVLCLIPITVGLRSYLQSHSLLLSLEKPDKSVPLKFPYGPRSCGYWLQLLFHHLLKYRPFFRSTVRSLDGWW